MTLLKISINQTLFSLLDVRNVLLCGFLLERRVRSPTDLFLVICVG